MSDPSIAMPAARERRRYYLIVVLLPLLGGSLGVNGAPVFQILAIENLGLDAKQVGLAVGLGAISIPFQILAARIPLRAAHRNIRLHVWTMALFCLAMAWLIRGPISPGFVVAAVVVIAVMAELAVSVLFATSFQPLLSTTLSPGFRQRLNGQGRAAGGIAAIGLVALVGAVGTDGRIAILVALAVIGVALVPVTARLGRPPEVEVEAPVDRDGPARQPESLTWVFIAIGVSVVPAWPFFVTYSADAFWPDASLGLVGAAVIVGPLGAGALWRPTTDGLLPRARLGALATLACALVLLPLSRPISGGLEVAVAMAAVVGAGAAGTIVRMALLEVVHTRSTPGSAVAALTNLDVIASTCMQLGFLGSGFLITASVDSTWPVDPFQLSLLVGAVALLGALTRIRA